MRFSIDTIIPKIPGASRNKGRNQKVKIFSGKEYCDIATPLEALLKLLDLSAAKDKKSSIRWDDPLRFITANIFS
ncbi:hypothetical protein GCM10023115_48630 [Pontixanthobacter gangjinensis]